MYDAGLLSSVYFELDIIGNVRRLRGGKALSTTEPLASDLGGYRYTAFGHLNTTDTTTAYPSAGGTRYDQPLRWQSRWFIDAGSGLYDFRARVWSPELAAFLQPDEYGFLTKTGTLWSWAGQNPFRWRDPAGRGPEAAAAVLAPPLWPVAAAAAGLGLICAASADCRGAVSHAINWIEDACTPEPENPPRDCGEICGGYIGSGKKYVNENGDTVSNDRYGNAQYAYYECLRAYSAASDQAFRAHPITHSEGSDQRIGAERRAG